MITKQTLLTIIAEVLEKETDDIDENVSMENTPDWDSLSHLAILSDIGEHVDDSADLSGLSKCASFTDLYNTLKNLGLAE